MFNNSTILITGGTGSFGKKYTQILLERYKLKKIIIFSRDELKQSDLQKKIFNRDKEDVSRFFIGDVRDLDRLKFATRNIDYIIHLYTVVKILLQYI